MGGYGEGEGGPDGLPFATTTPFTVILWGLLCAAVGVNVMPVTAFGTLMVYVVCVAEKVGTKGCPMLRPNALSCASDDGARDTERV